MSFDAHKNLAYSSVSVAPSPAASGTSLTVATGDGALFPAVPFNCTIWPTGVIATAANAEIVRVTNRVGDVLTITRAQEGTSARTVVVGDQIAATITSKTLEDVENAIAVGDLNLSLAGNTSGTLALISSGTVIIAGGNNITLSQVGNSVTISAFNQSVQTQMTGLTAGISTQGNTSGTTGLVSNRLLLVGGNNITLSQSVNAGSASLTISGPNTVAQTVQTQNLVDISLSGNTSGVLSLISSGTAILAGGNNITLSQNGQSVTISGPNTAAQTVESNSIGISNVGNTSGTTGVASGGQIRVVMAGGNNVTLSQSLNGDSATITISAFNQTVQTQNCVDLSLAGNTSGALALISSGTAILAGGNNITLSQNGQSITISAGAGGAAGSNSIGMSNVGNTSGTTGVVSDTAIRFILAGGNNITLSQSLNGVSGTVTISAFNQTVESQSAGISNLGNTSGTSGIISGAQIRFLMAGGNNITLSQSTNGASATVTISAFNQSVQTQGMVQSLNGSSSQLSISAGNLMSISNNASTVNVINVLSSSAIAQAVSSASAAGTLSSRFALADHAHAGVFSVGVSTGGNTSGNTTVVPGQLVLAGGNNVTLSVGTAAGNLMTVTISAGAGGTGGGGTFSAGISTDGNTSGTSGTVSGQMIFVGGNNITLSQSTNGASGTITISAVSIAPPTISYYAGLDLQLGTGTQGLIHASNSTGSMWVFPLCMPNDVFPGNMSVDTVIFNVSASHTNATSTTQAHTTTLAFGIYGVTNRTQLTRLFSGSTTWGSGANNSISSLYNGVRFLTIHSSNFDAQPTLSNTSYFGAIVLSAANSNSIGTNSFGFLGCRQPLQAATNSVSQFSGFFNAAASTATSYNPKQIPFMGLRSAGGFSTLPPTLAVSDMVFTNTLEGNIIPDVRFINSAASGMFGIV